jgi:hypothetical protein
MNGRIISAVLLVLVLVAGVAGLGYYAYTAGVSQGLIDSGKLVAPATGVAPGPMPYGGYPYYGPFFFHRPFGFGWGIFGCLIPVLFFFLFFGLLRGVFGWRRHWGGHYYGMHGDWKQHVPPMFEEWHKQAHGETSAPGKPDTGAEAK